MKKSWRLEDMILRSPDAPAAAPAASPSSAPTSAPSSEPAPSSDPIDESADDFSGLEFAGDTIGDDGPPPSSPSAGDPAPSSPVPNEPPKQVAPPAPLQPDVKPAEAAPPAQQTPAATPPENPQNPQAEASVDAWSEFEKNAGQLQEQFVKQYYALSDEDVAQLEAEPATALPKMAAKIHYNILKQTAQMISGMLPHAFQHMTNVSEQARAATTKFQEQWPQIDVVKFGSEIEQTANVIRQLNPKATQEEVISMVGATISARHKLVAPANPPAAPGTPPPQAQQRPAPFVPASPGAPAATPQIVDQNEWAGLGGDYE